MNQKASDERGRSSPAGRKSASRPQSRDSSPAEVEEWIDPDSEGDPDGESEGDDYPSAGGRDSRGSRRASSGSGNNESSSNEDDADDNGADEEANEESSRAHPPGFWHTMLQRGYKPGEGIALLADDIKLRSNLAGPKLMENLAGKIKLSIERGDAAYEFDWSKPAVSGAAQQESECKISIGEDNLLRIACGDLNPQIAMLSDKIKITGRHSLALYFFNLVAPRVRI